MSFELVVCQSSGVGGAVNPRRRSRRLVIGLLTPGQQDPIKIRLEMIAQWSKYCFGVKSQVIVPRFMCICLVTAHTKICVSKSVHVCFWSDSETSVKQRCWVRSGWPYLCFDRIRIYSNTLEPYHIIFILYRSHILSYLYSEVVSWPYRIHILVNMFKKRFSVACSWPALVIAHTNMPPSSSSFALRAPLYSFSLAHSHPDTAYRHWAAPPHGERLIWLTHTHSLSLNSSQRCSRQFRAFPRRQTWRVGHGRF